MVCVYLVLLRFDSSGETTEGLMVHIGDDICLRTNMIVILCTTSAGTGPFTYLWSTGSTSSMIFVTSPGTYTCTVSNTCGGVSRNASAMTEVIGKRCGQL